MAKATQLHIRIGEAKGLPAKDMTGRNDAYCLVKVDNTVVARTATVWKSLEPFWGEEFTMYLPGGFRAVSAFVYDEDNMGEDDVIGRVTVTYEELIGCPKGSERWYPLVKLDQSPEVQGEVHLETIMTRKENKRYLRVKVAEARDLCCRDKSSYCDPFVRLSLVKKPAPAQRKYSFNNFTEVKHTKVLRKSRFPQWQKTFEFIYDDAVQESFLLVELFAWDRMRQNEFLGQAKLDLTDMPLDQLNQSWYPLSPKQIQQTNDEVRGTVRIKFRLIEETILPSEYYSPLTNLLTRSVCACLDSDISPLTILDNTLSPDQKDVPHALVKLFLGQGMVLKLMEALVIKELQDPSNTPSTLFRGNTMSSKCFEVFLKTVGMPYLHITLQPTITKICEEKKYCELDPFKLDRKTSVRRLSLRPVEDEDMINRSLITLRGYFESVMNAILGSLESCPPLIRAALRNLAYRVNEVFCQPENKNVKYIAVSGFLFLRFFTPAILGPKLFALSEQHPDKVTSRTLTLLAKAVQKVGNLGMESGSRKERWMAPLESAINEYIAPVIEFVDRLIDIGDFEVPRSYEIRRRSVFHRSVVTTEGFLKSCHIRKMPLLKPFKFRRRYCWLSCDSFTHAPTDKSESRLFVATTSICAVEKVEDSAFQKSHIFQIVSGDSPHELSTLYFRAQNVNESNKWISAIRKTTLANGWVLPYFHLGVYRGRRWTCCQQTCKQAEGCSRTQTTVMLSDWRDPLNPDLEAQIIFRHLLNGREEILRQYQSMHGDLDDQEILQEDCSMFSDDTPRGISYAKALVKELLDILTELENAHQEHDCPRRHSQSLLTSF